LIDEILHVKLMDDAALPPKH